MGTVEMFIFYFRRECDVNRELMMPCIRFQQVFWNANELSSHMYVCYEGV